MLNRFPGWLRVAAGLTAVGWGANQFAALLPVYRHSVGLTASFTALAFTTYVVGLIPTLFFAAEAADRADRRWPVRVAVVLSAATSALMAAGSEAPWLLLVGRLLSGVAVGAALAPATAWVTDLSTDKATAPRRVAISLSVGFGGGPLVAGIVAQWAPLSTLLPYVVHVALSVVAVAVLWRAPDPSVLEEDPEEAASRALSAQHKLAQTCSAKTESLFWRAIWSGRFWRSVPWTAPWVFGAATMSFAVAPTAVHIAGFEAALDGITAGITMASGVLIQPLAQQIERRKGGSATVTGLGLAAIGMALSALVFATREAVLLLPTSIILGSAYGAILVGGLRRTTDFGHPSDRARLSAVFYSLTYVGFAEPLVFTAVADGRSSQVTFALVGVVVAAVTAACQSSRVAG